MCKPQIITSYVERYGTKTYSETTVTPICNCYPATLSLFKIEHLNTCVWYTSTYTSIVQVGTMVHCYIGMPVHIV